MHRLGARQSTRHQQPAGGGLPQPGGRRRWRQQRNRLLRCRATSPGIVLPQLPPGRATGLPPDWPPDLAPHWPPHLAPDWPPCLASHRPTHLVAVAAAPPQLPASSRQRASAEGNPRGSRRARARCSSPACFCFVYVVVALKEG
jgi:hypothetical protein